MAIHTSIADGVGVLTLDRPDRAHAYDRDHLEALLTGFQKLACSTHVVVVQSTGERAFCAGADLKELGQAAPVDALDLLSQRVFAHIADSPVVSIAAVHGAAVAGGCELTLACDLRVVGPRARFSLPETGLGIIPAAGGCTRLPRLVGQSIARQIILAGESISAERAVRWGLAVGEVSETPREQAMNLARRVAERSPLALRMAKQVMARDGREDSLASERVAEAVLYGARNS